MIALNGDPKTQTAHHDQPIGRDNKDLRMVLVSKEEHRRQKHYGASCMANPDKPASIEKMILLAYEIGREEATKEVSNAYANLLHKIRERADQCRYHHMVRRIIGDTKYIYHSDYAGRVAKEFGGDLADV